ncbi:hypothetical protein IWQ57_002218, partial [Coemansia nantahalensis]
PLSRLVVANAAQQARTQVPAEQRRRHAGVAGSARGRAADQLQDRGHQQPQRGGQAVQEHRVREQPAVAEPQAGGRAGAGQRRLAGRLPRVLGRRRAAVAAPAEKVLRHHRPPGAVHGPKDKRPLPLGRGLPRPPRAAAGHRAAVPRPAQRQRHAQV